MVSIYQDFEFVYPEGELFFDRSGALTRQLRAVFPGLVSKTTNFDQREFSVSYQDLNLFFGIALSQIQSFAVGDLDFNKKAGQFLECVTDIFEITSLNRFSFKHVLGRPCSTLDQAQELMGPLIGDDQKEKMASFSPTAVQCEFIRGPFIYESRIAIMNLESAPELNIGGHLLEKMQNLIFPIVKFTEASLEEAIDYLSTKSRDHDNLDHASDSEPLGVALELESKLPQGSSELSLDLRDVSMLQALRHVVELAGVKFKPAPDRIFVVDPFDDGDLPHITVHLKATGHEPISLAEFDVSAFILNFREQHTSEILSKLAPHLI